MKRFLTTNQKRSETDMLLLKLITDRAKDSRHSDCFQTFEDWIEHWFNTASAFRQECLKEGLLNTVSEIDDIVVTQHKFCSKYNYTGKPDAI
jgi:hypothetical protein